MPASLPRFILLTALAAVVCLAPTQVTAASSYNDLVTLFREWREFQKPKMVNGVPDYSPKAMKAQHQQLKSWQQRLARLDISTFTIPQKVDYNLVRAEMNGLDFDHRVLRPWARSPFFYRVIIPSESDTPLHEGPHVYGAIELWEYTFPLSAADAATIRKKLDVTPKFLSAAKANLTEDDRDLWTLGLWGKKRESQALESLATRVASDHPDLAASAARARESLDEFTAWLEKRHTTMKRAAPLGIDNYNWYLRNVHLSPYTWQDLVRMMEREMYRSLATMRLEQQRNRKLPPPALPETVEELDRRNNEAIDRFLSFLREDEIFSVPDYMNLDRLRGVRTLIPKERLDIFSNVEYRDSLPMKTHMVHWLEKQRMLKEPNPSPIRSARLLYNIWDTRSEGFATAWEEATMNAGLFDDRPRARELIYVMTAVRAVRGLADLKYHSGEMTLEEAMNFIVEKSPNGWFNPNGSTMWVDMGIYAHQPSYGTTYLAGKIAFDRILADKSTQVGDAFRLKTFMDEFFATGVIPMSMIHWEMTGLDDEASAIGARK